MWLSISRDKRSKQTWDQLLWWTTLLKCPGVVGWKTPMDNNQDRYWDEWINKGSGDGERKWTPLGVVRGAPLPSVRPRVDLQWWVALMTTKPVTSLRVSWQRQSELKVSQNDWRDFSERVSIVSQLIEHFDRETGTGLRMDVGMRIFRIPQLNFQPRNNLRVGLNLIEGPNWAYKKPILFGDACLSIRKEKNANLSTNVSKFFDASVFWCFTFSTITYTCKPWILDYFCLGFGKQFYTHNFPILTL